MTLGAGKEVISYCNKCKLPLAHTIVAMKANDTIGKCVCNTCKAKHAFKDPATVTKRKKRTTAAKKEELRVEELWLKVTNDPKIEAISYSIKKAFKVGDLIDHTKFGPGVVLSILDQTRIEVVFKSIVKQLVQNK